MGEAKRRQLGIQTQALEVMVVVNFLCRVLGRYRRLRVVAQLLPVDLQQPQRAEQA